MIVRVTGTLVLASVVAPFVVPAPLAPCPPLTAAPSEVEWEASPEGWTPDRSPLDPLRIAFHRATADADFLEEFQTELDRWTIPSKSVTHEAEDPDTAAILDAYRGALDVLQAKHGRWPISRIRHLRSGIARLDDAILRSPDNPEARYLRLASEANFPRVFRRDDVVCGDWHWLLDRPSIEHDEESQEWPDATVDKFIRDYLTLVLDS